MTREDAKVLEGKKMLENIFPDWGSDYEETYYDKNGDAWGSITIMRSFYVKHNTGEISTKHPEED